MAGGALRDLLALLAPTSAKPTSVDHTPSSEGLAIVQTMQRAVNISRKANARVKKLKNDLQVKAHHWEEFQKTLRQTYLDQKQQFETDTSKLERELEEAKQMAIDAENKLKEVAQ